MQIIIDKIETLSHERRLGILISNIPENILINYPKICYHALKAHGELINIISEKIIKRYPDMLLEVLKHDHSRPLGKREIKMINNNKDLFDTIIKFIEDNPKEFVKVPQEILLQQPKVYDTIIKFIENDPTEFEQVPQEILLQQPKVYDKILKKCRSLKNIPDVIKNQNEKIVIKIVKNTGDKERYIENYEALPDNMKKKNPRLCFRLIEALQYNPEVEREYDIYSLIPKELLENKKFVLKIFQEFDKEIIFHCNEKIRQEILGNTEVEIGPEWQKDCLEKIKNSNNVILSSPTGSGKTNVFLEWAKEKKERPIFITAPIKALSNQRSRELKEQGYIVGLETGDIKDVPENCDFICCTQEIYTNKYIDEENVTLIMDEFHYIFENSNRARTYIDSLNNAKAKNILLCSATMGNIEKLEKYVNKVSKRQFYSYEGKSRLTKLQYNGKMTIDKIKDALVVTFSRNNIKSILRDLDYDREETGNKTKIKKIASKYNITNNQILQYAEKGLAGYYGGLLPKEKLFIEECFEKKLIDTVVGTDALAMGVNFPVENVVFAQLSKYKDGPISKNLFDQLAGRAGRKGYFDIGKVYYCNEFKNGDGYPLENKYYSTRDLYIKNFFAENEDISISLQPNIKDILMERTTIDEEASYIAKYSTDVELYDYESKKSEIEEIIDYIQNYDLVENVINDEFELRQDHNHNRNRNHDYDYYDHDYDENDENDDDDYYDDIVDEETEIMKNDRRRELEPLEYEFYKNIAKVYFEEFDVEKNCKLFQNILLGKSLDEMITNNVKSFQDLLRLRKYLMKLPYKYRNNYNLVEIENKINELDETALNTGRGHVLVSDIDKGTRIEQVNIYAMKETMDRLQKDLEIEEKYADLIDYWEVK